MVEHNCIQQERIEDIDHRLIIREQRGQFREERLERMEQTQYKIMDLINELNLKLAGFDNIRADYEELEKNFKLLAQELVEVKQEVAEFKSTKETSKWFIGAIGVAIGVVISFVGLLLNII